MLEKDDILKLRQMAKDVHARGWAISSELLTRICDYVEQTSAAAPQATTDQSSRIAELEAELKALQEHCDCQFRLYHKIEQRSEFNADRLERIRIALGNIDYSRMDKFGGVPVPTHIIERIRASLP